MRDYDIVLFGASGFTGRLVAEYLLEAYGQDKGLRWAIAGRNEEKLKVLARELGAPNLPVLVADSDDPQALASLAACTTVVCTTVGPYALYGSALVAACVTAGTHYCDLTGEVHWMREMIGRHEAAAVASGARIVHTCGFDSIPSDLGTLFLQQAMLAEHGVPAQEVKLRVKRFSGAFSGGTVASMINMMEEAGKDKSLRKVMADPYALLPRGSHRGDDRNDQTGAVYDYHFGRWTLPFVMAAINTRVVRRSNALLGFPYGEDFAYSEAMLAPRHQGRVAAKLSALAMTAGTVSLAIPPLRAVAKKFLPAPGEGPDREQREKGFFDIYLYGVHPDDGDKDLIARVTGDRDPGYGSTSKMLAEAAVCLAMDELDCDGGFWTPASAMGETLIQRLEESAGLTFTLEDATP
ncbi:saccharopine dehydrogenase family protein [Pseudohalioglobus lutimaris]|uniref:Saccharopine dehydrogenase n=1 Tax=Pseudohalioglobus lutimaris TaxID=1737061 RepID=A0A2N5WY21_9GAMM|nr:saccharopine dehydrogenase NADP-binding domain-containing protein [Pseudohalioglobus lutimaris]PLW67108.1 saccharopine dehydrogenase [Pseudohalioglobus lutimaris]